MNLTPTTPKIGRFRRGMALARGALRVLRLDKELMMMPIMSALCNIVAVILLVVFVIVAFFGTGIAVHGSHDFSSSNSAAIKIIGIGAVVCAYILTTIISNFFSGAIIYGATQRFKGGNPTVRSSIAGASRKFGPLAFFSIFTATVGLALQVLENRIPFFAAKAAIWWAGAAWSVANVFAIPVIVLSDKKVQPLAATKESVKIIRNVWGESVAADLGISLVGLLSFVGYIGFWVLLGVGDAQIGSVPALVVATLVLVAVLGLLALIVLFSTLTGIVKAALYHYATTGEAPSLFDQRLLQASMTPKKARRIFG